MVCGGIKRQLVFCIFQTYIQAHNSLSIQINFETICAQAIHNSSMLLEVCPEFEKAAEHRS
jgi:hypothetical protein